MRGRRKVALVIALATLVAGCGDDGSPNGRTKLTVQLVPVSDVIPVYLGIERGFFRDEGLDLEIQIAQGGAEIIPLVANGRAQIGYSNTPSLFIAASKELPIEIVAPGGRSPLRKEGSGENLVEAVMVKKDSSIRTAKDLEGKTVAVNTLKSISDVTTSAALEERGVDHTKVNYLEVPLPDMQVALDSGGVDAIFTVSPFKTIAERSGNYRPVLFPLYETRPGQINTAYFVSRSWAADNEEVLERFLAALRKSMNYADAHEREMRQALTEYLELPEELAPVVPIGDRSPNCRELKASSKLLVELMSRYGALEESPDSGELIRPGFCEA